MTVKHALALATITLACGSCLGNSDPPSPSRVSSTPTLPLPSQSGLISKAGLEQALGRRYEIQKVDSTSSDIAVIIRDLQSPQRWVITYETWSSQQAAVDQFNAQKEIVAEAKLRGMSEPNFCVLPSVGPNYCSILQHKVIVGVQRVPGPEKNFGGSLRRLGFIAQAALTQTQNVND